MTQKSESEGGSGIRRTISRVFGLAGMIVSVLLLPPVFSRTLAMSTLLLQPAAMWTFAIMLFIFSGFVIFYRGKGGDILSTLLLGILAVISLELAARFFVVCFTPNLKYRLAESAIYTYPEYLAVRGHPFLQYTYNPKHIRIARSDDTWAGQVNRFGFLGPEYTYEKPDGVIRIACLGGSTTARSYPLEMEALLNRWNDDPSYRFEALNFGVGGYNTANSLVNLVLNVIDFEPDYVVIHHAWNENVVRNTDKEFRSDYTHNLIYFHEPVIPDQMLIRSSIIYRALRDAIAPRPLWSSLGMATNLKSSAQLEDDARKYQWKNLDELKPYRRNIKTMLDVSRLHQIRPVLTTQPHSTNPGMQWSYCSTHIDQCNAILRELRGEYGDQILFVDVDSAMTGRMDSLFTDVGHTNKAGYWVRAELIGRVIFADWTARKDSVANRVEHR